MTRSASAVTAGTCGVALGSGCCARHKPTLRNGANARRGTARTDDIIILCLTVLPVNGVRRQAFSYNAPRRVGQLGQLLHHPLGTEALPYNGRQALPYLRLNS